MKNALRQDIAYIAARLVSGLESGAIYDYQNNVHINLSGQVTMNHVSVYDYSRGCFVTGSGTSLYDYGDGNHVSLTTTGAQFNGFDYASNFHFSGNVNGRNVTFYDYETNQHYNYSI